MENCDKVSLLSESLAPRDTENSLESDGDENVGDESDDDEYEERTLTDAGDDYDDQFNFEEEMDEMRKLKGKKEKINKLFEWKRTITIKEARECVEDRRESRVRQVV